MEAVVASKWGMAGKTYIELELSEAALFIHS